MRLGGAVLLFVLPVSLSAWAPLFSNRFLFKKVSSAKTAAGRLFASEPSAEEPKKVDYAAFQEYMKESDTSEESSSLEAFTGRPAHDFMEKIWQREVRLFDSSMDSAVMSDRAATTTPYHELLKNGWKSLQYVMDGARNERLEKPDMLTPDTKPMLFREKGDVALPPSQFGNSTYHGFLYGCSTVCNHADNLCPYIANVCEDFQKSFPHAYANVYITPPNAKAVPPHADDRDVFIIQVLGKKSWKVYDNVPVAFPYTHEQYGKNGLDIPDEVLNGTLAFDMDLRPGDVLYIPRGYVHEASTPVVAKDDADYLFGDEQEEDSFSFHVTIALATHDWTLAGLLGSMTQGVLAKTNEFRKSVPASIGRKTGANRNENDLKAFDRSLQLAFAALQNELTPAKLEQYLQFKYQILNAGEFEQRQMTLNKLNASSTASDKIPTVGREAVDAVTLDTRVRAPTAAERASIPKETRNLYLRKSSELAVTTLLKGFGKSKKPCRVRDLMEFFLPPDMDTDTFCQLSVLSLCKYCVEFGAMALADY